MSASLMFLMIPVRTRTFFCRLTTFCVLCLLVALFILHSWPRLGPYYEECSSTSEFHVFVLAVVRPIPCNKKSLPRHIQTWETSFVLGLNQVVYFLRLSCLSILGRARSTFKLPPRVTTVRHEAKRGTGFEPAFCGYCRQPSTRQPARFSD